MFMFAGFPCLSVDGATEDENPVRVWVWTFIYLFIFFWVMKVKLKPRSLFKPLICKNLGCKIPNYESFRKVTSPYEQRTKKEQSFLILILGFFFSFEKQLKKCF